MTGRPQVRMAERWERESANGNRYFMGFMGGNTLLLFRDGERPHPTRADETIVVWNLILQERDQAPGANNRPVTRSDQWTRPPLPAKDHPACDRSRDRERHAARTKAAAAGEALLAARDRPPQPFYDDTDLAVADLGGCGR